MVQGYHTKKSLSCEEDDDDDITSIIGEYEPLVNDEEEDNENELLIGKEEGNVRRST